jgi:hypothetical protein
LACLCPNQGRIIQKWLLTQQSSSSNLHMSYIQKLIIPCLKMMREWFSNAKNKFYVSWILYV